jgi:hypothetical protein
MRPPDPKATMTGSHCFILPERSGIAPMAGFSAMMILDVALG